MEAGWRIYASVNCVIIGPIDGLSPTHRWTNAKLLPIGLIGINFSYIWNKTQQFSSRKMHLEKPSVYKMSIAFSRTHRVIAMCHRSNITRVVKSREISVATVLIPETHFTNFLWAHDTWCTNINMIDALLMWKIMIESYHNLDYATRVRLLQHVQNYDMIRWFE